MNLKRLAATAVAGGLAGAVVFWLYQVTFQGGAITAFLGAQIVRQGGYALPPALVGWAVHLGVSFGYALLLGLVLQVPWPVPAPAGRTMIGLAAGLVLGWATNLIAPPAIQVTVALLSGKGLLAPTWPLNPSSGHPFWNHLLFFAVVWAVDWGLARLSPDAAEAG